MSDAAPLGFSRLSGSPAPDDAIADSGKDSAQMLADKLKVRR